jgi:arsenite methyltransferase
MPTVDAEVLEAKVKQMYRLVVEQPHGVYHFAMGRPLAERLGYHPGMLDRVPVEAVESFAGVGYVFGLAQLVEGERVLDLGSGSGMDACYAAQLVGSGGRVIGIDFTPQQVARARRLAAAAGLDQVEFHEGRIESIPAGDGSVDCDLQRRGQPVPGQGRSVHRSGPGAATGWPTGDRRHRQPAAAEALDRL